MGRNLKKLQVNMQISMQSRNKKSPEPHGSGLSKSSFIHECSEPGGVPAHFSSSVH